MVFGLTALVACGGGSPAPADSTDTTAPTISSVTKYDAGANTSLSATTPDDRLSGTNTDSTFTVTFSEALDDTTMTADNVTLVCNDVEQTIDTPTSTDNTIWTITPSADLTGYADCTLTIGTGVKNTAGVPLAEAATYVFSTQCSTDDDFSVDTLGFTNDNDTEGNCWYYRRHEIGGDETFRATYFNISDGLLQYHVPGESLDLLGGEPHGIYKKFESTPVTITLESYGLSGETNANDGCGISIWDTAGEPPQFPYGLLLFRGANPGHSQSVSFETNPATEMLQDDLTSEVTSTNPLYLQLSWDGTSFSANYRLGSTGDYTVLGSLTPALVPEGAYEAGFICFNADEATTFTVDIGSFDTDTTATGPGTQY